MSEIKKISVYLVEDYGLLRLSLLNFFKNNDEIKILKGFETAEDCIEEMKTNPADIILMDLGLPQMNGIEATKIINEKYPKCSVIELTSHETSENVMECINSGARGYVLKGTPAEKLVDIIKAVYSGALYFDNKIEKFPLSAIATSTNSNIEVQYTLEEVKELLSSREFEVLKLIAQGKTNSEIAELLFISLNTVKAHVGNVLTKLDLSDRVKVAVLATKLRIV
ncbi:MAG: response regulator [Candidatus Gastranaerophilaceae bacterium]